MTNDSVGAPRVDVVIREERRGDIPAIRDVNRRAFPQEQEANLVDALRSNHAVRLSLVATLADRVVGHIMYSPAQIDQLTGAGLGPMAVLPELQRHRIGSMLVEAGNRQLNESGCPFIIVLGHAEYYPRFGFVSARPLGITCDWDVPDEVFMVLVLDRARMHGVAGRAQYRPEFSIVA
jgi:putative acetyltransferase